MASLVHQLFARKWSIVSLDPEVSLSIEGQYQPDDGWQDEGDPIVSGTSSPGSRRPATQWVAGGPRQVTIRSSWRSLNFLDDIRPKVDQLRALRNQDPTLGRAPRVLLTWGDLQVVGFVTSCPIRIQGYWATGLPRGCAFQIQITEAEPLGIDSDQPTLGETQFVYLRDGETFETLGRRYYGQALKGELIRRENPAHADQEEAGDLVRVLEAEHPSVRRDVVPTSPPLLEEANGGDFGTVVGELAELRGSESNPGMAWEHLPEVVAGEV